MLESMWATAQAGGLATWALLGVSLLLWFTATLRALTLLRGFKGTASDLIANLRPRRGHLMPADRVGIVPRFVIDAMASLHHPGGCRHDLDRWTQHAMDQTERHGALLRALVATAPLLGLLGTVTGMIETFASMRGQALAHAAEQTIAGGISLALISTQLGLTLGVPGLIVARLLDTLQSRRQHEILEARALLAELYTEVPR